MEFFDVLHSRQSIRNYDRSQQVTDEQITSLLEAAVAAPSAGNLQSWFFVVVREPNTKREIAKGAGQPFAASASVILVICADLNRIERVYGRRGLGLYCLQDTAAAAENILLAATSLGLGGCWVGAFDEAQIAGAVNLDDHLRPVALILLGYPADNPRPRKRRPLSEVSRWIG